MKTMVTRKNMVCVSLILVSLAFAGQSSARIDPASIAGAWLFDEGSGNTVKDISENGNDGEFVGDPQWVKGKFGEALEFNGTTDYVAVPDSPSLRITDAITIVAWVYIALDQRTQQRGTVLGKWSQIANTWSYVLYDESDGGGGWRYVGQTAARQI